MDAFLRVYDLIPFTVHCEENSVKMKMQYNNKVPSASIFKRQSSIVNWGTGTIYILMVPLAL